jgi:hypothetical protein
MATTKKKSVLESAIKSRPEEFRMSVEVKEWIERADSTIQHLRGKVERLEQENKDLKVYRKFAEQRILRSEHE